MAETTLNLYQKLLKITEEVGMIEKTGKNSMQNYSFIEQAHVVAALRPQLEQYGVFIIPETVNRSVDRYDVQRSNGKPGVDVHASVIMRFTVVNADKPEERFVSEWDAGEAIDSGDKATNKATTAGHKTYLMKLFNISDKDDTDAESPQAAPTSAQVSTSRPASITRPNDPASDKQKALIRDKLAEQGISTEAMPGYLIEQFGVMEPKAMTKEQAGFVLDELLAK